MVSVYRELPFRPYIGNIGYESNKLFNAYKLHFNGFNHIDHRVFDMRRIPVYYIVRADTGFGKVIQIVYEKPKDLK